MFLNLINTVGNDLTQYDDTEAWPSLFDDFVEFENDTIFFFLFGIMDHS